MEGKNPRVIVSKVGRNGVELQGLRVTGRVLFESISAECEREVMFCEVSCPVSHTFSFISYHR